MNPTQYDFIIIGAGPAGLAAGIAYGKNALVIDRNHMAGRKLLLSGSGQCNYTNSLGAPEFLSKCGKAAAFLKPALYNFDGKRLVSLLQSAGCESVTRADGKVFPASLRASDIRDALLKLLVSSGADIRYDTFVQSVSHQNDTFYIQCETCTLSAPKLLFATGGCSYPITGSDGSGYDLAHKLGYEISELIPALAALELRDLSMNCPGVVITPTALYPPGHKAITYPGDILFTHKGLSGPGILDNVHHLHKAPSFTISLIESPDCIYDYCSKYPRRSILSAIKAQAIPEAIALNIIKLCDIDAEAKTQSIPRKKLHELTDRLMHLSFLIKNIEGWDKAMATAGGIKHQQIKARTMESRLHPGLYFAGEMLDYSLPSGGYNIQIAFSTGYLAGQSAKKG